MNYREALDYLLPFFSDSTDEDYYKSEVFAQSLDVAVTALKKQIAIENAEKEQKCRVCGCTWNNACVGGCYWVEEDLCNQCAERDGEDRYDEAGTSKGCS